MIPRDFAPVDVRHEIMAEADASPASKVVSSSTFQAKPMSLDEAVLQMDLLNSRFYVFQDARSRALNVVYRRDDGKLGVIEARPA